MNNPPSGTVTFLFTDIEGSTRLWQDQPEAMSVLHPQHDLVLRDAIESNHGYIFQVVGDSFSAGFHNAIDGLSAALSAQRALQHLSGQEPKSDALIRVRMGLHTGAAAIAGDGTYDGYATIASTQRVMSAANGGQTLLTQTTYDLLQNASPGDVSYQDMGEHRLKDLRTPLRLYQVNAAGLPQNFPALKSLGTLPNNLPIQLTSFVGRERELRDAREKLSSARLLTLIGPGGTGKTRLSLQLGKEMLAQFADGVWFVELAPLADPALILQTIASVLNVRAQMGMPLKDIVTDFLRAKNLLLIFDNCEHLVESCAEMADQFLHNSPDLKIIVSSREALGIHGETVYRVPSLSLPDAEHVTREALAGSESIQLFTERARAANPKFDLTEKNAASVAQICRRLDGIPLALELAAARVTVFSAEQIAARLDDRFKLLTGGSRTALPRQQTLRALIDWSHDILPEHERILLRRLSVFAGGWTFEAAEALCPDLDVLTLLTQLVNKSLVAVDDEGQQARYRLLETIRQYARDKLLEADESIQTRNLHLDFFLAFAEQASPMLESGSVLDWLPRLDVEYDNFRVAFEWGLDNQVDASLRFVWALASFWFRRGHGAEGIRWAEEALARAEAAPALEDAQAAQQHMQVRANALTGLAWLAYSQGDNPSVVKASAESIQLARQLGDKRSLAFSLTLFGAAKVLLGDPAAARASVEEAVAIARERGEKTGLGAALNMLAMVTAMVDHDPAAALAYEEESIAMFRDHASSWSAIMSFFGAARGAMFRGDYVTARERFRKVLPAFEEMRDEHRVNMIHSEMAHIDRYEGNHQKAEAEYRKTILVWQKLGHRAAIAHQFESFAFIAKSREQAERAARLFGAAEGLREKINIPMSPQERIEYGREIADLRRGMDEKSFASLWAEGRALTMEQAIHFALAST